MYGNYTGSSVSQSNNNGKSSRPQLSLVLLAIMAAFLTLRAARRLGGQFKYSSPFSKLHLFGKRSSIYSAMDAFDKLGNSANVADTSMMKDYGGVDAFQGIIATASCAWGGCSLERVLQQRGHGRVLVIDGVGDMKKALLDHKLAHLAYSRGWKGIILNGCIRSAAFLKKVPIGVKALGTHIRISGGADATIEQVVSFSGVQFIPGHYIYADSDGVVVSEKSADTVKWSVFGNKNKHGSSLGGSGGAYYGSSGGMSDGVSSYNNGASAGSYGSAGSTGYGAGGSAGYGTGGSTGYGTGGSTGSTGYGTGGSTGSYGSGGSNYGAGGGSGSSYGSGGSSFGAASGGFQSESQFGGAPGGFQSESLFEMEDMFD